MNSGGITISLSNLESFTKFAAPPGEPLLESSACAYNDGSSISRHAASSSSSTSVIYCLGGIDIFASKPPGFVNTLLAYNLNTRTWTAAHGVEMFNGMAMALTIFQNNILYTIGGK